MFKRSDIVGFYLKILVTICAPIILYWNELVLIFNEAIRNDLSTHIIAIPFLVFYVLYRERKYVKATINWDREKNQRIMKQKLLENLAGISICSMAFIWKLYGSTTFYSLEYHTLSFPVFITGLILVVFDYNVLRALSFPILMMFFLVPPPFQIAQRIGSALATFSAYSSYNIVKFLNLSAHLSTEYGAPVIYLSTRMGDVIPFAIDVGCSGIYSLIGFIIFAVFLAYISKGSYVNKSLVLFLGLPVIYSLNVVRVTTILIVGYFGGENLALNVFHLLGGWILILFGTMFLMIVAERLLKVSIFKTDTQLCNHSFEQNDDYCTKCGMYSSEKYLSINKMEYIKLSLIIMIVSGLLLVRIPVFSLSTATSDIQVGGSGTLESQKALLPDIDGYELGFVYRDVRFENLSHQDASLMYQYRANDANLPEVTWVAVEIAPTKAACHPWEACLITYAGENKVTQIDLRDIKLSKDPPITARYFAFIEKDMEEIQVVLYWYTLSTFKTDIGYEDKWVKLSVISYAETRDRVLTTEKELLSFALKIIDYWRPIKSWSPIMLSLAKNGITFVNFYFLIIAGSIEYNFYLRIRSNISARKIFNQLEDAIDIEVINAVNSFKDGSCESEILEKYLEISNKNISIKTIKEKLQKAEKIGLIEKKMVKIENEPYIFWRAVV